MKEFLKLYREAGGGNVEYFVPAGAFGPVTATALAPGVLNDGLSVTAGIGKLGGPLGAAAAANLLDSREIPLNGFQLVFSQIGGQGASVITSFPIFKKGAATLDATPIFQVQNSAGAEEASFRITNDGSGIYIGQAAGQAQVGANSRSVGIGAGALQNTIVGFENTAIGFNALQNGVQTGFQNTAVGSGAMQSNVSGGQNAAIGWNAMNNNTGGSTNTAFGSLTLGANTTGSNNTAIGSGAMNESLVATSNPSQNTVIGAQACTQQTLGINNIVIGYNNSFANQIGNSNILIGAGGGALAVINNTTLIGTGQTSTISNIVGLGIATQNVIIGQTAIVADNGNRLQISGKLNTGGAAPLTTAAGAIDFGSVKAAASVLNAAQYWEVSVNGVLLKVCIN